MSNELLPCPFCGRAPILERRENDAGRMMWAIFCDAKVCEIAPEYWCDARTQAEYQWNRRTPPPAQPKTFPILKGEGVGYVSDERPVGTEVAVSGASVETSALNPLVEIKADLIARARQWKDLAEYHLSFQDITNAAVFKTRQREITSILDRHFGGRSADLGGDFDPPATSRVPGKPSVGETPHESYFDQTPQSAQPQDMSGKGEAEIQGEAMWKWITRARRLILAYRSADGEVYKYPRASEADELLRDKILLGTDEMYAALFHSPEPQPAQPQSEGVETSAQRYARIMTEPETKPDARGIGRLCRQLRGIATNAEKDDEDYRASVCRHAALELERMHSIQTAASAPPAQGRAEWSAKETALLELKAAIESERKAVLDGTKPFSAVTPAQGRGEGREITEAEGNLIQACFDKRRLLPADVNVCLNRVERERTVTPQPSPGQKG